MMEARDNDASIIAAPALKGLSAARSAVGSHHGHIHAHGAVPVRHFMGLFTTVSAGI